MTLAALFIPGAGLWIGGLVEREARWLFSWLHAQPCPVDHPAWACLPHRAVDGVIDRSSRRSRQPAILEQRAESEGGQSIHAAPTAVQPARHGPFHPTSPMGLSPWAIIQAYKVGGRQLALPLACHGTQSPPSNVEGGSITSRSTTSANTTTFGRRTSAIMSAVQLSAPATTTT